MRKIEVQVTEETYKNLKLKAKALKMGVGIYCSYELEKHTMIKGETICVGSYDSGKWTDFVLWTKGGNWDNLLYLEPLTREQYYNLVNEHGVEALCQCLISMENYRPIVKNKSIHKTAKNWLSRSKPKVHQ